MQTQADLLVLMMKENDINEVYIDAGILKELWEELEYQGRAPRTNFENWRKSFIYKLRDDTRFIPNPKIRKNADEYRVFRLKQNVPDPERDYVRVEDVLYAMSRCKPSEKGYVNTDELIKYFDCKPGSVRYRLNQMAKNGIIESKSGTNHGYRLKGECK